MRSLDEIWAGAQERVAFSTGTDGDLWMEQWCLHCDHEPDCPLLDVAMSGWTPAEWRRSRAVARQWYICTEYQD